MRKLAQYAWRNIGMFIHAAGFLSSLGAIFYVFQTAEQSLQANSVAVDKNVLGAEVVLRSPRSLSFLYRVEMKDVAAFAEVYRVGHLYTVRVEIHTKEGRWWEFLRPAKPEEAQIWHVVFPHPYADQAVLAAQPDTRPNVDWVTSATK